MLERFYYLQNKHRSTSKKSARRNLKRWQSVQDPYLILFENCRCSWNRSFIFSTFSDFYCITPET